jgi:peptidoglycan/LPS O-acetylase OafA/YrhL
LVLEHHTISDQSSSHLLLAIRDAGSYGVCIFFLLSAYLITELLLREKENAGDISLRRFYIRCVHPVFIGVLTLPGLSTYNPLNLKIV